MLVEKRNYGEYSSDNYGSHTQEVTIGGLRLWFSYDTIVAFDAPGKSRIVSQNVWSTTTGKHLNWIDGGNKTERVDSKTFERELNQTLIDHNLYIRQ